MDRGRLFFCAAVCLEVAVCFAFPVFMLIYGIFLLPVFVASLLREPPGSAVAWVFVGMTVLGSAGIFGVVRVLVLLCRQKHDTQRWLTLGALACGVATALVFASRVGTGGAPAAFTLRILIAYLPLGCALHLVYLARRPLFSIGRPER
jgi:hypothetical protein